MSFTDDNSVPEERTSGAFPASSEPIIDDTLVVKPVRSRG